VSERLHFAGSRQTIDIVLDGAATGGALALMTLRMPPGAGSPLHRHRLESETLVVREGSLVVEVEGERRELSPGEAVFLARGALHSFSSDGGAVVDVLAVPSGLEEFFRAICVAHPDAPPPDPGDVAAALERHGLDFSGT
jgi:quercetin dioxygenase-like cupin family protein